MKATYFAAASFAGQTEGGIEYFREEDLVQIAGEGHEIGSHSFGHEVLHRRDNATILRDLDRNDAYLREIVAGWWPASFAYPYGEASPRLKRLCGSRFAVSRGIAEGVNGATLDLAQLRAVGLESKSWTSAKIESAVAEAAAQRGWLVLFTHDISESPSPYGATPLMLDHALETIRSAGIEVLPLKHALARTQTGR